MEITHRATVILLRELTDSHAQYVVTQLVIVRAKVQSITLSVLI